MSVATSSASLAVLANAVSPYQAYFLRRLGEELPGVEVHALFTHSRAFQPWSVSLPEAVIEHAFETAGSAPRNHVWSDVRKGGRILDYLQSRRVEATICQGYDSAAFVRVLLGCRARGIAVFLRGDSNVVDDDQNPRWKRWLKGAFLRPLLRRVTGVMPMGSAGMAYYLRYGARPDRAWLVPVEPDYDAIRAVSEDEVRTFRERRGFRQSRRRLLFAARMARVKRPDLAIEGFRTIAERRPDWDLVLAGDGPLRRELEAGVPDTIRSRVRFLGFVDVQEMRALYRACDALVLPSDREPWALVVNEALAAGVPVVASDVVGAARDLVVAGENGAIFRRGDVADLSRALLEATDPDRADSLRAATFRAIDRWRTVADPVRGVREALAAAGLEARLDG